jgi:hypothetical protein
MLDGRNDVDHGQKLIPLKAVANIQFCKNPAMEIKVAMGYQPCSGPEVSFVPGETGDLELDLV